MPFQPLWIKKLWVSPPFYSPYWKGCALPISSTYNTYNYTYRSDLGPTTLSVTSSYDITTSSTFGTPFLTFRYLKEIFYYSAQPNSPYLVHTNLITPWNYFLPSPCILHFRSLGLIQELCFLPLTSSLFYHMLGFKSINLMFHPASFNGRAHLSLFTKNFLWALPLDFNYLLR